jgi:hypothetical protein
MTNTPQGGANEGNTADDALPVNQAKPHTFTRHGSCFTFRIHVSRPVARPLTLERSNSIVLGIFS